MGTSIWDKKYWSIIVVSNNKKTNNKKTNQPTN